MPLSRENPRFPRLVVNSIGHRRSVVCLVIAYETSYDVLQPEPRIKSEIDAEEEPSAVVVVGFADLVVRKTRKKRVVYDSNVKNFKKFRKVIV